MKSIIQGDGRTRRGTPRRRAAIPLGVAVLVALPLALAAGDSSVSAVTPNLPTFPDNIVIFPNRDFVTLEGFADHAGETGLVEVTRPGVGLIGSAEGVASGEDVAFEVNHPGGYCWGAGTGLLVTPDILPGDVVTLSFGGHVVAASTTIDISANDAIQNGTTVTVTGHIGNEVPHDQMEQRIIEPALVDTAIGRRDVRALPGPPAPAPKGGYVSGVEFGPGEAFTATYVFDNLGDATIAAHAGLGERGMAWEFVDAAGNRQGLTIAENGEPGGPGMGGCPNGPQQSGPPAPTNVVAANVGSGPNAGIKVNWTPVTAIPGTPAVVGYRVTATAASSSNNEQIEIGRRIMNPGASSTTITGLSSGENYDITVVSLSSNGETFPPVHTIPASDITPPTVVASPPGGTFAAPPQVTLTTNEFGADIYYTLNGDEPSNGDQVGPTAIHYTGPFTVPASSPGPTTLKFVAFDPSNNHSNVVVEPYVITNDPVPTKPLFTGSSVGFGTVTLNWAAPDPGLPTATIVGYQIKVFTSDPAQGSVNATQTITTGSNATSATISGLAGDVPLWFTVSAQSDANLAAWGPPSDPAGPLTPQGVLVANAGSDQIGVVRGTVVTLSSVASSGATSFSWRQIQTGSNPPVELTGGPNKVTLVPSGNNATFTLPLYAYPIVNEPLTFELTVGNGTSNTKSDLVVIAPRSDVVTIGTAKWKSGDFRVTGTATTVGSTVTLRGPIQANGTSAVLGTGTVTAAAPPAVGGEFDIRLRNGAAPANPGTVYVDSNLGGTAGPFTVTTK